MNYKYIYENPSENRQLYMYSDYNGKEFIEAYKKSRSDVLIKCLKKINSTEEKLETSNKLLKLSNYNHINKDEIISIFCNIVNVIKESSYLVSYSFKERICLVLCF